MQVLATDPGDKTKMGNCTAVYDAETDTVHLVYLKNLTQAFHISTTDGGETFTPPNEITSAYDEFDFFLGVLCHRARSWNPVGEWATNAAGLDERSP